MSAIDEVLSQARDLEIAIDHLTTAGYPSAVEGHLARGIAVQGFATVENFLRSRAIEWQSLLSGARLQPQVLPDAGMRYGNRLVEVLPRILRNGAAGLPASLLNDVAVSLTSLSSASWTAHHVGFGWTGSNAQESDVDTVLSLLGYDEGKVWGHLTQIWQKVDPHAPGNSNLRTMFGAIAGVRHHAAHDASPNLPIPTLATLPGQIRTVCLCIDAAACWGIRHLRTLTTATASVRVPPITQIPIRRIQEQNGRWSEFGPRATQAFRRHPDLATAMTQARARASGGQELIVARTRGAEVADWSFSV